MKIYAMTYKGSHSENEDSLLINNEIIKNGFYYTETDSIFACIADGVGGNNAGAVASELVCTRLSKSNVVTKNEIKDINAELIKLSNSNKKLNNMATTLSAVIIRGMQTKLIHIGNTRIYIIQSGYLKQLTEDHTTVNWLVKTGQLSKKEAEVYDKRNEIFACMGGGKEILMNMLVFEENVDSFNTATKIIITSDGIHEYVNIDELENFLNQDNSYEFICEDIIQKATDNGSEDDKSIIIIER